jgi:serine O-acetyltransferase
MLTAYAASGDLLHIEREDLPSKQRTIGILDDLLTLLFPSLSANDSLNSTDLRRAIRGAMQSLRTRLQREIVRSLRFSVRDEKTLTDNTYWRAERIAEELLEQLPEIKRRLSLDIEAAYEDDPAAQSVEEVILSYPCVYAIAAYRIAHELYLRSVPVIPRIMSEHAHTLSGVDIHPGARIGENFFIDHGTGVVIGETADIGNNVRIYQGVTVGARSLSHQEVSGLRGTKRHPTIEDDVVIYSGATILGGTTVIGKGSIIGGNVWITSSIRPHTTVMIAPPKLRTLDKRKPQIGTPANTAPATPAASRGDTGASGPGLGTATRGTIAVLTLRQVGRPDPPLARSAPPSVSRRR